MIRMAARCAAPTPTAAAEMAVPVRRQRTMAMADASSSGTPAAVKITPTYNQTGTAGGTDLLINRTQTAVGSGTHKLLDAQVAGVSKFAVTTDGRISANSMPNRRDGIWFFDDFMTGGVGRELALAPGSRTR